MSEIAGPKRYGDKEISRILKRATEIQTAEPSAPNPGGMTLEELEEIALEAGIDPRYLRRAAMEVEAGVADPSFWARVVGDELILAQETVVPGELPESGFERCVSVIQQVSHEHGQPSLLGRTLTWQAETASKSRSLMVVVSARGGETHVRVEERLHQLAGQLFGGITGGAGAGIGIGLGLPLGLEALGSALFAVAFPLGVLTIAFLATREVYRVRARGRRRVVGELLDRLVAEVSASIGEATLAGDERPKELTEG